MARGCLLCGSDLTCSLLSDVWRRLFPGFDAAIYQAYAALQQPPLAVLYMQEKNTWEYAYPIQTTRLERLLVGGGYQSPSIDGFLKYLGQCSGVMARVAGVEVWRQHVQAHETFKTPLSQSTRKEALFRESTDMKRSLLAGCLAVLSHEQYRELDRDALMKVRSDWLLEPHILNGPTGVK